MEGGKDYYEMLDLGIGKCKFIVAGLAQHNLFDKVGHVKIGTKYPNLQSSISWKRGWMWSVLKSTGLWSWHRFWAYAMVLWTLWKLELTLKENGLVVFDTVCDISARVIVNKASFKLKRTEILAILEDMKKGLETLRRMKARIRHSCRRIWKAEQRISTRNHR